jgi:hypothetical protein
MARMWCSLWKLKYFKASRLFLGAFLLNKIVLVWQQSLPMTVMTVKRKILFYIPLLITTIILANTWATCIFTNFAAHFTNYIGLFLFIPVVYFLFKDKTCKKPLLALGIYLILATFYVANISTYVGTSMGITLFGLEIPLPPMNGSAFLLLLLYCILNIGTLIELQLDHKESKGKL